MVPFAAIGQGRGLDTHDRPGVREPDQHDRVGLTRFAELPRAYDMPKSDLVPQRQNNAECQDQRHAEATKD